MKIKKGLGEALKSATLHWIPAALAEHHGNSVFYTLLRLHLLHGLSNDQISLDLGTLKVFLKIDVSRAVKGKRNACLLILQNGC